MKKKSKRTLHKSEIVVNLPHSVELTRRTTSNELNIDVWVSGSKRGILLLAQGSVTWKPSGRAKERRLWWSEFADLLEKGMPLPRSLRQKTQAA
jgi:hypothetical protein